MKKDINYRSWWTFWFIGVCYFSCQAFKVFYAVIKLIFESLIIECTRNHFVGTCNIIKPDIGMVLQIISAVSLMVLCFVGFEFLLYKTFRWLTK